MQHDRKLDSKHLAETHISCESNKFAGGSGQDEHASQAYHHSAESNAARRHNNVKRKSDTCTTTTDAMSLAAERLKVAFACLRSVLKTVPSGRRFALLQDMPHKVRARFLEFMECRQSSHDPGFPVVCDVGDHKCSDSESCHHGESTDSDACNLCEGTLDREQRSAAQMLCVENLKHSAACAAIHWPQLKEVPPKTENHRCVRVRRGVVLVKTGSGRPSSYLAVHMFAHLHFFTRCQPKFEMAVDNHILLVQIRNRAMMSRDKSERGDRSSLSNDDIQKACYHVLADNCTSIEEIGLRALVRLQFGGTKKCVIKHRITSPVLPLNEALTWRERLLTSMEKGWNMLRIAWIQMLQHPGYKHKRPLSATEAVAFVDRCGEIVVPVLKDRLIRQEQRHAKRLQTADDRLEQKLQRALRLVHKALESESAAIRKHELEAGREQQRLMIERVAWLRRKPGRDMTMEDLLAMMPPHLQQTAAKARKILTDTCTRHP
eukprot:TRINITY_DN58769_c0_g1_i1.p1 TRINITY_DN58769_c0_g1~~TRINITY_DN58769_c0_g1_i1.p1  ORF type:complete len:565 (+),score=68.67 TRINITY_DN58769_c0_g1_i1:227-1696(+)